VGYSAQRTVATSPNGGYIYSMVPTLATWVPSPDPVDAGDAGTDGAPPEDGGDAD
jgi:hypothetical protein